jgi:hypothetical protein
VPLELKEELKPTLAAFAFLREQKWTAGENSKNLTMAIIFHQIVGPIPKTGHGKYMYSLLRGGNGISPLAMAIQSCIAPPQLRKSCDV